MLAYALIYPILFLISLLPFPLLYAVSNVLNFVLFGIIGYRKKIVLTNLRNAFPEKSEAEIQHIARQYYRYFCDLILETIKSISISYETVSKRFTFSEEMLALFKHFAEKKQSVIIVMGHHGNWEWSANAFGMQCPHTLIGIFKPLHNRYFNDMVTRIRTRFKTKVIPNKDVINSIEQFENAGEITATVFIGDQTPSHHNVYWTTFLNQETPVFWGTERTAKALNYPVIYANIIREKRGHYHAVVTLITDNPSQLSEEGTITEMHTRLLERDIIAQPETWIWTHRRWKHKRRD